MRLSRQDFVDVQRYVDFCSDVFAEHDLTLHSSGDMEAFAAFIASEEHSKGISASHDPLHSCLTPKTAFWLWLQNEAGERVASVTQKAFQTDSFMGEIFSHTLYDSMGPVLNAPVPDYLDEKFDLDFAGVIAYGGGFYIHPDYRGKGLVILANVSRSIALRYFKADWFVGIQRLTKSSSFHSTQRQNYTHTKPFIRGMPYKWDVDFQIAWSSGENHLDSIRSVLRDAAKPQQASSHSPEHRRRARAAGSNRA